MVDTRLISDHEKKKYFLHRVKYEVCIYIVGVIGLITQVVAAGYMIFHLVLGMEFLDEEEHYNIEISIKGEVYSIVGVFFLVGSAIAEIFLLRAVYLRILTYIQFWMFFTFLLFMVSVLMTVIVGGTLLRNGVWITLSCLLLVVRLAIQMYFVDGFTHAELLKEN